MSYSWRQCVQPLKAFKTNSTQKNSDSIRQHHCVRLSEKTGGGSVYLLVWRSLAYCNPWKYTHNRHILGCLKVILNISPEGIKVWRILAYYNPWNILLRDRNILGLLKCHTQWSLQKGQKQYVQNGSYSLYGSRQRASLAQINNRCFMQVCCILAYCNPWNILIWARYIQGCLDVMTASPQRTK